MEKVCRVHSRHRNTNIHKCTSGGETVRCSRENASSGGSSAQEAKAESSGRPIASETARDGQGESEHYTPVPLNLGA